MENCIRLRISYIITSIFNYSFICIRNNKYTLYLLRNRPIYEKISNLNPWLRIT